MNCNHCGEKIKENGVGCDWRQGRCPHRQPILTNYHFRFFNIIQLIKRIFNRG